MTNGHFLLIEVVEMALTQMGFILYVTRHSLTICQSKTKRVYFWCGYRDLVPWDSSSGRKWDANAFVFSLTNREMRHAV